MWGSLKRRSPRRSLLDDCRSDDSDFCHEMLTRYGFTEEQMHRAAERFHLGRSKSGKTIFWMIDDLGRCRDGHLGDSWVSVMLKARYPSAAPYICIEHCLFGLHQISLSSPTTGETVGEFPSIGIVESERSAVILSEAQPRLIWLAYVYPSNFTVNQFEPLQGRKITLYPRADPDQAYYWAALELADQVRRLYDIDISVSSFLDDHASDAQKSANIDLVDYLFENREK